MDNISFKIINNFEEFELYYSRLLDNYLATQNVNTDEAEQLMKYYKAELALLQDEVELHPDITQKLWMAALIGYIGDKGGCNVDIRYTSCPLLVYLLGLTRFKVFYEDLDVYHYYHTSNWLSNYQVDDKFIDKAKAYMSNFFEQTDKDIQWNEQAEDEGIWELTVCDIAYYFNIDELNSVFPKEAYEQVKAEERNRITWEEIIATGKSPNFEMSLYREDIWRFLIQSGMAQEEAGYWAEEIRRGRIPLLERRRDARLKRLSDFVGTEAMESFSLIRYLPPKWTAQYDFLKLQTYTYLLRK